jgi:hypothetical protein
MEMVQKHFSKQQFIFTATMHQAYLLSYNNQNYGFVLEMYLFGTSFTYVLMITTDYTGIHSPLGHSCLVPSQSIVTVSLLLTCSLYHHELTPLLQ